MIQATYTYSREAREVALRVEGHAGQGASGHDIVCAAASILVYTAGQIVATLAHHGDLVGEPVIRPLYGNAEVSCRVKDDYLFGELLTMLFAVSVGFNLLAHNYPQYVKFDNQFLEDVKP